MINLGEVISIASAIETTKRAEKIFNCLLWFRGQSNDQWLLIPSAHRQHNLLESVMAQFFRMKAPAVSTKCPTHSDYASWLPLMRHYGLPTRLLDWSESLLTALFFAVESDDDKCGHIYLLAPSELNILTIGRFMPFITDTRISDHIKFAFTPNSSSTLSNIAIYAPRTDKRMHAQQCCYTIHGNTEPLCIPTDSDKYLAKITIPKESKSTIKSELQICGVTLSSLFPDLQHLGKKISELVVIEK